MNKEGPVKTRIIEKVVDRRLRHVIQRRRWFKWHDVPGHAYPSRIIAIDAKFNLDRGDRQC